MSATKDSIARAIACRINQGFLSAVSASYEGNAAAQKIVADELTWGIWENLDNRVGWAGPKFELAVKTMITRLAQTKATQYHMGIETVGQMIGAETIRPTGKGEPDGVWILGDNTCLVFEAKSDKVPSTAINKDEILQANGHVDWIKKSDDYEVDSIVPIIIAPTSEVTAEAEPHVSDLRYLSLEAMSEWATTVVSSMSGIRSQFSGQDYSECMHAFDLVINDAGLNPSSIIETLTSTRLADCLD